MHNSRPAWIKGSIRGAEKADDWIAVGEDEEK